MLSRLISKEVATTSLRLGWGIWMLALLVLKMIAIPFPYVGRLGRSTEYLGTLRECSDLRKVLETYAIFMLW